MVYLSIVLLGYFLSMGYFSGNPMFLLFLQLPEKSFIYKNISDNSKKCLSVCRRRRRPLLSVARLQPTPTYVQD